MGAQSEQFGFVVGDQGSCSGTHAWHISFEESPGPQFPSLRTARHYSIIFSLTTTGKRSDEVMEMSETWLMLSSQTLKNNSFLRCCLIITPFFTCMNKQNVFFFFNHMAFIFTARRRELKRQQEGKTWREWFKSGQMVGANQAVSLGYITNREHAFNFDTLAFSLGLNGTMNKRFSVATSFSFLFQYNMYVFCN